MLKEDKSVGKIRTFTAAFLTLIMLFNFYFPSFNNILGPRLGFAIYSVLLLSFLLSYFVITRARFESANTVYLTVLLLMALNILFTSFTSEEISIRDLFELLRPVLVLLTIWFGYKVGKTLKNPDERIVGIAVSLIGIMVISSLIIYLLPVELRVSILSFYVKSKIITQNRISGTFVSPYDFSLLASFLFSYLYIKYIYHGGLKYLVMGLLVCASIILTQSKIGFILIFSAIFLVNIFILSSRIRVNKVYFNWGRFLLVPLLIAIFVTLIFIFYSEEIMYLVNGVSRLLDGGDGSTQIRAEQVKLGLEIWVSSPLTLIFGAGAMKSSGLLFENLYVLYLVRYGMVGLLLLIFFMLVPLYVAFKCWNETRSVVDTTILIFFILTILGGISNNNIDQMRISFFYFTLVGCMLYKAQIKKGS